MVILNKEVLQHGFEMIEIGGGEEEEEEGGRGRRGGKMEGGRMAGQGSWEGEEYVPAQALDLRYPHSFFPTARKVVFSFILFLFILFLFHFSFIFLSFFFHFSFIFLSFFFHFSFIFLSFFFHFSFISFISFIYSPPPPPLPPHSIPQDEKKNHLPRRPNKQWKNTHSPRAPLHLRKWGVLWPSSIVGSGNL